MKKVELIKEYLETMDEREILSIYNDYASDNHWDLAYMNTNEDLVEYFNNDLSRYLEEVQDVNKDATYFTTNGYGHIKFFDYIEEEIDLEELAQYVEEHWYNYEAIILIDFEEEEEEEE